MVSLFSIAIQQYNLYLSLNPESSSKQSSQYPAESLVEIDLLFEDMNFQLKISGCIHQIEIADGRRPLICPFKVQLVKGTLVSNGGLVMKQFQLVVHVLASRQQCLTQFRIMWADCLQMLSLLKTKDYQPFPA
ncbi:hypothetical protein Pelo_4349 [Pelomyxa schiedti]|nr:hypothetical protein Pelo_4349 [Pelomyxa schiedti]